jgi:hypothetical protein
MSISTANSSISYVGNNSTSTPYVVNYPFFDASDLKVYSVDASGFSTLLTLTTNYTVTGGNGSTGSVVTTAAIPATRTVIINRSVPYTQLTSLTTGDRLPAASLEKALDKVTMQTQQLSRNTLPDTAATAGSAPYVLGMSASSGNPTWVSQTASAIADGSITASKLSNGKPIWDTSGNLTATSFVGPLTGNVTGNVTGSSGSCTGNAATATTATNATTATTATTATNASNAVASSTLATTTAKAYCYVSAAGVLTNGFGVLSSTRTSSGNFTVTLIVGVSSPFVFITSQQTAAYIVTATAVNSTTYSVKTFGTAGGANDSSFYFSVFGS